jgi:hypothetical protein
MPIAEHSISKPEENAAAPKWMFLIQLIYLMLLIIIGLIYAHWSPLRRLLPNPAGPIPLGVPWWGALGVLL